MKLFIIGAMILTTAANASAGVECTQEPASKWKDQEAFKKELEVNYKIKKFKVTSGNCYEIYGFDKSGKKVEIYFNPVTGEKVKSRVE